MTQTIAQNLIINAKANNRKSNYGVHPITTFIDLNTSIQSNNTYKTINDKLLTLDNNYTNTLDELDDLISNARQTYNILKQEESLLRLLPTYSYITPPDKSSFLLLLRTINTLIEDCNRIINKLLKDPVDRNYSYNNQLIIEDINPNNKGIINRAWLSNYLGSLPIIPRVKITDSTLVCDNNGEIKWQ